MALTRTSIFGTVYVARLRKVVRNGSLALHSGCTVDHEQRERTDRPTVSTSQVSFTPRPVLVPPCTSEPVAEPCVHRDVDAVPVVRLVAEVVRRRVVRVGSAEERSCYCG